MLNHQMSEFQREMQHDRGLEMQEFRNFQGQTAIREEELSKLYHDLARADVLGLARFCRSPIK